MKVYVLLEIDYDWHNVIGVYKSKEQARSVKEEKEKQNKELIERFDCDITEFIIQESILI